MECLRRCLFTVLSDTVLEDEDDGYRTADVTSAADSYRPSLSALLDGTRRNRPRRLRRAAKRQRERAEREMEMTNNAMHEGHTDSGHSDPNRTMNDTLGVDTDALAARLSSDAPTIPSSTNLSSIDPSSTPLNGTMKRRKCSRSPQERTAKRQKEGAENAMFDGPVPDHHADSDSNCMTNDTPGPNSDAAAASCHASNPSSSAPLTRMQRKKLRSKKQWAAKRYKEKQMRLAQEAMSDTPLTECNHSDPNPATNDVPGVDNNRAPACLSGDTSTPLIL
ncbi:hypothetical protein F5887DRAFT_982702 [Amanita rubescens]|nr:hypothetical protein F5887DRAFT_982702 [Amanita rubescens]